MAGLRQTTISALFANSKAAAQAVAAPTKPENDESETAHEAPPPPYEEHKQPKQAPEDGQSASGRVEDSEASSALPLKSSLGPAAAIRPLTQSSLPSFRRLITTLLPVRYPDKTYAAILANAEKTFYCRLAVWRAPSTPAAACSSTSTKGVVVGAVCARVQDIVDENGDSMVKAAGAALAPTGEKELYVQMLAVLAPYRGRGLASTLLETVVMEALRDWRIKRVFAHVWEANEEALEWYGRRGFDVHERVIEEYYRKLKPRGARIVTRPVRVRDGLKR